jgi:hypothetical protein
MKDSKCLRTTISWILVGGMLTFPAGCNTVMQAPPDIPPASTFVIDLGDFAGGDDSEKRVGEHVDPTTLQVLPGTLWGRAALKVGVWNVVLTVGLVVPVAAFLESFNHVPEQQEDGTWVWPYDVNVLGIVHHAELHALAAGGDIQWNMFVTKDGFYEDFNWFSGVSNLIRTSGTWTLNHSPEDPTPFVGIEWNRNLQEDTGDIRYTNVVPNGPEIGGYIAHAIQSEPFDAVYDIFNKGQDNITNIEWNRATKDGRIKDPVGYGDEDWHCWDMSLQNADCVEP